MTDRKDYERYISWLEKQDGEKSQSDSKKLSEQIKDFEGEFGCWNSAQDFRPKHLQRCLCYDKYMKGVYCYVYDDMSKYWCTQTTEEHDPDGDNHICDYADYRVTVWMQLPDTPFYPSKSLLERQDEKPITIGKRQLTGKAAELAKEVTPESLEETKKKMLEETSNWTDEDERLCQCLINDQEESLNDVRNDKYGHAEIISDLKEMYRERINWLKSIKERVHPESQWTDEDIKMINILCSIFEVSNGYYKVDKPGQYAIRAEEILDWLKSFKRKLK